VYDCVYLALPMERGCRFINADDRLLRELEDEIARIATPAP
jgi:predicted nucleic acid-binding protein